MRAFRLRRIDEPVARSGWAATTPQAIKGPSVPRPPGQSFSESLPVPTVQDRAARTIVRCVSIRRRVGPPVDPRAISAIRATCVSRLEYWSRRSGLNRGPADYESAALPLSYAGDVRRNGHRIRTSLWLQRWRACGSYPPGGG